MSDLIPKPGPIKVGGLGPKAQKLQALREKAAQAKSGAKPKPDASTPQAKAKEFAGAKKVSFQRKAV